MIRESDRRIVGTRGFDSTTSVASDSTPSLIAAIDTAMQSVLGEVVGWVQAST